MEGSEIQDGLSAGIGPPHAGLLETLLDDVSGRRFDRTGADRKFVVQCPAIVEALAVVLKVLQQAGRTQFRIRGGVPAGKPLKSGKEVIESAFFELVQTAMPPTISNRVRPDGLSGGMEMLGGVIEI